MSAANTVVFYDGVCGLCDRFVRFLLERDRQRHILFAPLQGSLARTILVPRGLDPSDLDTMYVVADWQGPAEHVVRRSRALLHAVAQLDDPWPFVARVAMLVPTVMADTVYRAIAKVRYQIFGRSDSCPIPPPEWRDRFLD
jgi:predicted DCC family thiol-disulfide oxidoreductase YuxK